MIRAQPPVRLSAVSSEAAPSLRYALSAAVRHQPSAGELAQLALLLSPVLSSTPPSRAGAPSPSIPADPSAGARYSGVHWWGTGWMTGRRAIFLAGTAALLLSLPRLWSAAHPSPPVVPEVLAISSPPVLAMPQELEASEAPAAAPVEPTLPIQPSPPPARDLHTRPRGASAAVGSPVSPEKATVPPAEAQESEVGLLERARRFLQTDPRQTLELVREHERRFAAGVLVQEREIVAIDALERLGRSEEARARDDNFRARYPSSVHGKRIELPFGRR